MRKWIINPQTTPTVLRTCSKCKCTSRFVCSCNFRVNANGRNIDVWLIYKCDKCDSTWNMTIFSRVKPQQIDPETYLRFARNDVDLAFFYAFDKGVLNNNSAVVDFSSIEYIVEKHESPDDINEIEISCKYYFGLRLDKLLSDELGLSRTKTKVLLEQNGISAKSKINGVMSIMGF